KLVPQRGNAALGKATGDGCHERMRHARSGTVRQHIARARSRWRLEQTGDALRVAHGYRDRLWARGSHECKLRTQLWHGIARVASVFARATLAQFWHPLEKIAFLSPHHYHRPVNVLGIGAWPWRDMGVLLASGGAMWLTGGTVFARRDIYVLFDFLWSRWDSLPTPLWIPSTLRKGQGERWSRRDERESAQYQRGFPPQPNPLPRLRGRGRKPRPPLDTSGHSVFHPADRLTMPARTSQITRVGKRKV